MVPMPSAHCVNQIALTVSPIASSVSPIAAPTEPDHARETRLRPTSEKRHAPLSGRRKALPPVAFALSQHLPPLLVLGTAPRNSSWRARLQSLHAITPTIGRGP
jgi:hypothetical protein